MRRRILIVEDESIVQLDLQQRLESLGFEVAGIASSGHEAVELAAERNPDIIIMDVRLQGSMDGLEAARRIRASRHVPILYLTAYAEGLNARALSEAVQPCLSKPFRLVDLQAALNRLLPPSLPEPR